MLVYRMTFPNNKVYIGITIGKLDARMRGHRYSARHGHKYPVSCAIRKYGWLNIKIDVIDNADSRKELYIKERHYISEYNSNNRNFGYNCTEGGDGVRGFSTCKGVKRTEDLKQKLKIANIYKRQPVIVYCIDNQTILEFESKAEVARKLSINYATVKCSIKWGYAHKNYLMYNKSDFNLDLAKSYVRKTAPNSKIFKIKKESKIITMNSINNLTNFLNISERQARKLYYSNFSIQGWSRYDS